MSVPVPSWLHIPQHDPCLPQNSLLVLSFTNQTTGQRVRTRLQKHSTGIQGILTALSGQGLRAAGPGIPRSPKVTECWDYILLQGLFSLLRWELFAAFLWEWFCCATARLCRQRLCPGSHIPGPCSGIPGKDDFPDRRRDE